MLSKCFRYERTLLHTTAGVHVGRMQMQQANDARHSFNSNRVSTHIVSGMPLPIACSCSMALRSGIYLAAHSGMQLIICLLGCSKSSPRCEAAESNSAFRWNKTLVCLVVYRFMSVRHVESLPTVDGGYFQWEFADPGRLLSQLVQDVPQVQGIFAEVGIAKPCTLIQTGETMTKPTSWFDHRLYNLCEAM
jgi:hypothetical protein